MGNNKVCERCGNEICPLVGGKIIKIVPNVEQKLAIVRNMMLHFVQRVING